MEFYDKGLLWVANLASQANDALTSSAPDRVRFRRLQLDWKENGVDMNTSALMLQPSDKTDEMMINEILTAWNAQGKAVTCITEVSETGFPVAVLYSVPAYWTELEKEKGVKK